MSKKGLLFRVLSDMQFHCTICINKEIESGQLAKVAQNLRDDGFEMLKVGSRFGETIYCEECKRKTLHYKMISLEKKEELNIRKTLPAGKIEQIKTIFNNKDCFDLHNSNDLEIDHRASPYLKKEIAVTKYTTEEELFNNFQLLTKRNNYIKREECKKCQETKKRGKFSGIDYYYAGTEAWEGTCEGCFYFFPEKWREGLNIELHRK